MITLQNTKSTLLIAPVTAITTSRSASFDMIGADYATIRVIQSTTAGTTSGLGSVSILHADSVPSQATQFTTLTADLAAQATTSHEIIYHVDWRTKARYGKVILGVSASSNDTLISTVQLTQSRQEQTPSNTVSMVATTNDIVTVVA